MHTVHVRVNDAATGTADAGAASDSRTSEGQVLSAARPADASSPPDADQDVGGNVLDGKRSLRLHRRRL